MSIKNDFPIFAHNPGLIYLDSAATTQKPAYVIDGISQYLEQDYANIHRGRYRLSARSEELFDLTRQKVATFLNATPEEIIFTANSTDASNMLVSSLISSGKLQEGDRVVLSPLEHHANIVPWQMGAEQVGYSIERIALTDDGSIDMVSLMQLAQHATVVAITHVSNVTGEIIDLQNIKRFLPEGCLFIIDASQSVPHIPVDVIAIGCDFLWFTGHKMLASTGIGILYGRKEHLQEMKPTRGGGGAIAQVTLTKYSFLDAPDKFESGTPNLVGVVSLLKAIEYIETIGGTMSIGQIEDDLKHSLHTGLLSLQKAEKIKIIGPLDHTHKIGLYSFTLAKNKNIHYLGQRMGERDVCIRCGGLCAHPLHNMLGEQASCRVSLYIYNTQSDIEKFLSLLEESLS